MKQNEWTKRTREKVQFDSAPKAKEDMQRPRHVREQKIFKVIVSKWSEEFEEGTVERWNENDELPSNYN